MPSPASVPRIAAVTFFVAATVAVAWAADPEPAGGLAPARRMTREELVRKWDLNADGKIDEHEAAVASSRMRRERAELRLNSGIDPVTGRPRDEEPPTAEREPVDVDAILGTETDPPAAARRDSGALPGTRVPRAEATRGKGPVPAAAREPVPRPSPLRQPIMGGVRGGGVAARPGYGSRGPAAPLNAGRSIDSLRGGGGPGGPQPPVRGGLVPRPATPRPPRDTFDPY